jgi:hypothetical protein
MKTDGCRMHCIRSFSVLIYFLYIFGRQMMSSKQLPSKQIENTFKLPKKKFERFRKYIIAVVIIKSGDFEQIAEYVKLK